MDNCLKRLSLSKNEFIVLLIALTVALAAKGAALFPLSYAVDDYSGMLSPSAHSNELEVFLSQGRFGLALLSKCAYLLGAGTPLTNTVYALFYMVCLAWVGIIVCRMWKIDDDMVLSSLVVLMISIHPYQAELFTFKISPFYIAVSYLAAFTAFYMVSFKWNSYVVANILLMFALGIYQISLNLLFITLCITLCLEISCKMRNVEVIDWKTVFVESKLVDRIALLCSGVIFYLLVNKLVQLVFHVSPNERALFIKPAGIPARLSELVSIIKKIYLETEPVLPASVKKILIILLVLAVVFIGKKIISCSKSDRILSSLALSVLVLMAGIVVVGVIIPMQGWWPVPRVLSGVSFFWAGIVAFAYLNSINAESKFIVIGLCCIVMFSFIGVNNHIFTDQLRVNMRDRHKASRIVARMESQPAFSNVRRVAIVGTVWGYPAPIYTTQGDMNISAFGAGWSKVNVLKEVSGYNFGAATENEQKVAIKFCEYAPKWPSENSLIVLGDLCIVCQ